MGALRAVEVTVLHPIEREPARPRPPAAAARRHRRRRRWRGCASDRAGARADALGPAAAKHSARCTAASCSGSVVHELAVVRAVAGDPIAIDRVETWPEGAWPPSVAIEGRLGDDARLSIGWHFLPDYPAYREDVRFHYEHGSVELSFPAPYRLHEPTALVVSTGKGETRRRDAARFDRGGVRARAPRVRVHDHRRGAGPVRDRRRPRGHRHVPAHGRAPGGSSAGSRSAARPQRCWRDDTGDVHGRPHGRPPGPAHPLGPGVVRAVPDLPAPAGRPRRRAARADGGGQPASLHARRPVRDGRRLPRGPSRGRAADPPARRRGPARDRAVADPDGRIPRLGRDDGPQPRARLDPGRRSSAARCASGTCPTCSGTSRRCPRCCAGPASTEPSSGAASRRSSSANAFTWASPDGSAVEAEYLVGGYGNGAYLFDVPDRLKSKLAEHVDANEPFYGRQLDPRDVRHRPRGPLPSAGRSRRGTSTPTTSPVDGPAWRRWPSTPRGPDIEASPRRRPADWTGELRSGARANMLMNVTSARVDLKIAAARAERLLERYAEPLTRPPRRRSGRSASSSSPGGGVVDNSAHDSICGCSHDEVVAQVLTRYAEAEQIGRGVLSRTLDEIARGVPAGQWVAINPSPPRARTSWSSTSRSRRSGSRSSSARATAASRRRRCGRARPGHRRPPAPRFGDPRAVPASSARPRAVRAPDQLGRHRPGRPRRHAGRCVVFADDIADPPELDIEELLGQVDAAVAGAAGRAVAASPSGRRSADGMLARVPMPALGWSAIESSRAAAPVDEPGNRSPTP